VAELDIAAFLRARLDEQEIAGPGEVAWASFLRHGMLAYTSVVSRNGDMWVANGQVVEPVGTTVIFDQAFVLADVAAKRQILHEHLDDGMWKHAEDGSLVRAGPLGDRCSSCLDDGPLAAEAGNEFAEMRPYPCRTLRLLALPYAGHPDYREEWKP